MQVIDNKLKYEENVNHSTILLEMQNNNNDNNIDSNGKIETTKKDIHKKKRLYISWLLTTLQFIAITLQIIKYGTSGKAMVSGWSKTIQIIFCGSMNIYLKCSSYDFEYNNKFHVFVFVIQRTIIFGGYIYMLYTDSNNNFESFTF